MVALVSSAVALEPSERLADPALEARARALSAELRCVVCQNQSIDDSDAELAKDLRVKVRERLNAGDTDAEVKDFLVARYGEFVLLRPRVTLQTTLLWAAPALLLALAVWLLMRMRAVQTAGDAQVAPLTREEQARLNELLKSDDARGRD
ncbi:MAG: cytochrome c-type biogenesis protein [Pseudomonadota bacterium]